MDDLDDVIRSLADTYRHAVNGHDPVRCMLMSCMQCTMLGVADDLDRALAGMTPLTLIGTSPYAELRNTGRSRPGPSGRPSHGGSHH